MQSVTVSLLKPGIWVWTLTWHIQHSYLFMPEEDSDLGTESQLYRVQLLIRGYLYIKGTLCVCVYDVYLLNTLERLRQSPPDFQGSSRAPRDGLRCKNFRGHGRESENWHFSYTAVPTGEAWVALCSPSLRPCAAIATGRPRCWSTKCVIHSVTLRCGWAGSVHSLTGGRGTWGGRDVERTLTIGIMPSWMGRMASNSIETHGIQLMIVSFVCSSPLHGFCMLCRSPGQWSQQGVCSPCAQFVSWWR